MHPRGKLNFPHICCSYTLAVEVSRKEVIKPLASRPRLQQWRATRQKTACPIPFGSITHPSSCHGTYKTNTSTTTSMEEILCCVRQLYSIQSSNYWVLHYQHGCHFRQGASCRAAEGGVGVSAGRPACRCSRAEDETNDRWLRSGCMQDFYICLFF
jgi:hypothetical protein